jgi:hypothetical protein
MSEITKGFRVVTLLLDGTVNWIDLGFSAEIYPFLSQTVGGYIEAVPLETNCTMYINEEGKLRGLPINYVANLLAHKLNSGLREYDYIVGNAVICGPLDGAGYDTSMTEQEYATIVAALNLKETAQ